MAARSEPSRRPLTARGFAMLLLGTACAVAGWSAGIIEPLYVGVAFLALVAAAWVFQRAMRANVEIARRLPEDAVEMGAESTVEVHVRSTRSRTIRGTWRDRLPPGLWGDAGGALPAGSGSHARLTYAVTGMRRGRHAIGPFQLTTEDPFGLWRRTLRIGDDTSVLVVPRAQWLPPLPRSSGIGGDSGAPDERRGQGTDDLIPRPYAPGDSMRRIHWRASAHRGEFMVREEEESPLPAAVVVLDLSPHRWPAEARAGDDPGFETAVSACVSAAWRLACDGFAVSILDDLGHELAQLATADGPTLDALQRSLAPVAPRTGGEAAPIRLPSATGPLIVLCGALDGHLVDALARGAGRAAIAVLLTPVPLRDALERARHAGWASARLGDDTAAAWDAAIGASTTGGARGRR